jgi:hypothetical protein
MVSEKRWLSGRCFKKKKKVDFLFFFPSLFLQRIARVGVESKSVRRPAGGNLQKFGLSTFRDSEQPLGHIRSPEFV